MYKILAVLALVLFFSACSNSEAEAEIARLKHVTLQSEIKTLQGTLDSIKAKSDSIYKSLSDMDMNPNP